MRRFAAFGGMWALVLAGGALAAGPAGEAAGAGEAAARNSGALVATFVALLFASAIASSSETAIFSLTKFDLMRLRRKTVGRPTQLLRLVDRPNDALTTILVLNNFVNVALSLAAGALTEIHFAGDAAGFAVAAFGTTALLLIFGEVVPKSIAHARAVLLAPYLAIPISAAARVLAPVRVVMNAFLRRAFRRLNIAEPDPAAEVSEEELKAVIGAREVSNLLEEEERDMISGVFELRHTFAEEIMTPRADLRAIPSTLTQEEALARMRETPHSRVLVFEESPDHILGFVLVKEALLNPERPWREFVRDIVCVPTRVRLLDLLKRFRRDSTKIALVVDEYGGVAGIVTLHDLMEEIVGDMAEMHEHAARDVEPTGPGRWRVSGRMNLDDLESEIGRRFPDDMGTTIAGFVMNSLGRIPTVGSELAHEGTTIRVTRMVGRRIMQVEIDATEREESPAADAAEAART